MVGEPVVFVSHQTIPNWTNWLPSKEKAWPVHIIRNGLIDRDPCPSDEMFIMVLYFRPRYSERVPICDS
jgi:hypothetical protein